MRRAFKRKDSTKNHYLRLVRSDIRITLEDLKLLFEKDLEHNSSYWIFAVGALVGILTFALGNVTALGPNALSTYSGRVATVVSLTAFAGIMLFLYVIDWERVSGTDFSHYIEARTEIGKLVAQKAQPETPTASSMSQSQPSNVSETPPPAKRDVEIDKLRLAWDFGKSIQVSMLAIVFSAFVGIASILTSLLVTNRLNPISQAGAFLGAFFVITYFIVKIRVRLMRLVISVDKHFEGLEKGESVGSFKVLCEVEEEPGSPWEEFYRLFPHGRAGVVFVAILALWMIVWGFFFF